MYITNTRTIPLGVGAGNCYKCETPYENDYLQCSNCHRRFHLACASDQIDDGMDEVIFRLSANTADCTITDVKTAPFNVLS